MAEVLISETETHLMNYGSFPSQVSITVQNSCEKGSCKHFPGSLAQVRHRNIEIISVMLWLANVANHSQIFSSRHGQLRDCHKNSVLQSPWRVISSNKNIFKIAGWLIVCTTQESSEC